ncbi:MAG: sensor histidine kinase [Evtepia sp.]|uniref:sensor histidine kinase n=1 Tax=Evtepia sp. TaxID=2773933 RepID=UPI002A74920C|nr:sensor histidine kinase [Evtepia sp.]MDY3014435.1 sensor histidine kinase [Evtepia sp.]
MRSNTGKRWVTGLLFVLCVASFTASIMGLLRVSWLAGRNAYQWDGRDQVINQTAQELIRAELREIEAYYLDSRGTDDTYWANRYTADASFFFDIKDSSGKVLLESKEKGDYLARDTTSVVVSEPDKVETKTQTFSSLEEGRLEVEKLEATYDQVNYSVEELAPGELSSANGSRYRITMDCITHGETKTVLFTGYIRSGFGSSDQIGAKLIQAESLYFYRYELLVLTLGGAALGFVTLALLLRRTGRPQEEGTVTLSGAEKAIPLDVQLFAGAVAGLCLVALGGKDWDITALGVSALFLALGGAVLLLTLLSFVRQKRAGTCRENLLCLRLARPLVRRFPRLKEKAGGVLGKLPLFWGAALGFGLCCFLEGLCILDIHGAGPFFWFVTKGAEGCLLIYLVLSLRTLQEGGEKLAAGDLHYKVPLEKLKWDFRSHGENLNSIRESIQKAVEEQMKSERMKTELITNVSHDIKTPLTSIVNYVDLMKKEEMPNEKTKEYLEVLDRQSARLKKLTEDLVEASKASTGNITVNFQRTDVNVLLSQCAGEYQERLKKKVLDLVLTPAEGAPAISADGRLLWRVFENLLSNIEKYAMEGTRVYLTCEKREDRVEILFRNISADPLNISADELMERFVRGDSSRNTEGSGLGLSIARSLTQLQRGTFRLSIDGDLFKAALSFPLLG